MPITLSTPAAAALPEVIDALSVWQQDGLPFQLHPGDLGWAWQIGAPALAARVRAWRRDGQIAAVGFLDGAALLRLAIAPEAGNDEQLADAMLHDVSNPRQGVLPAGPASIEAGFGEALRGRLRNSGWTAGEAWTPLTRDLAGSVPECGLRIETVGPALATARRMVQNAAFSSRNFTEERWHAMAAGYAYRSARCLLAYDAAGTAVATATVWSAGPGRPGLLEPMGVHDGHRGHGYGTAITLAAASALREMGASAAHVYAEASNTAAVATYSSAGFVRGPDSPDFHRDG
ncbi:GNAT family N-acetyltransferase [Arthrobacter sp. SW1]|uniref:GNAT family N-acetyltransferase n=1 Tax=Arthrobacter sp. SW1 TaxID=1920889 RepID=UPI000877DFEE|nr:GNAT family N-acetyltransferase [Arthrobacter sp. SW1]OFI38682.1 GNAT family N-acetyltransferase [Arthrobacter sp. SW1]